MNINKEFKGVMSRGSDEFNLINIRLINFASL